MMKSENKNLKHKKLFLLDMDGTLYLDNILFPGTKELLSYISSCRGRYIFLTNNSSRGVESYVEKMTGLGLDACCDDFITSVDALTFALERHYGKDAGNRKIYAMGTGSFRKQLSDQGFNITDKLENDIEILAIGFDRELTFEKLEDACILLGRNVDYFATNPDWVCPTSYGYVPDCGSFCEMLKRATGRSPIFVGKPEPEMVMLAMERCDASPEEVLVVGDRLYTDIACGENANVDTVFLLSGEGTREDLKTSPVKPTYVMENVGELLRRIKNET